MSNEKIRGRKFDMPLMDILEVDRRMILDAAEDVEHHMKPLMEGNTKLIFVSTPHGNNEENLLYKRFMEAKGEHNDERHICPLQLDVIERCIQLWTNKGDTVYSPFMGIGSEGYCAIKMGRKFIGCELKESYYRQAVKNLENAEQIKQQDMLI